MNIQKMKDILTYASCISGITALVVLARKNGYDEGYEACSKYTVDMIENDGYTFTKKEDKES